MIVLNVLAALGVIFAGRFVIAVHTVHAYSTYVEMRERGVVSMETVWDSHTEEPESRGERYDIVKALQGIGAMDHHVSLLANLAAGAFLLNAALSLFLVIHFRRRRGNAAEPGE